MRLLDTQIEHTAECQQADGLSRAWLVVDAVAVGDG